MWDFILFAVHTTKNYSIAIFDHWTVKFILTAGGVLLGFVFGHIDISGHAMIGLMVFDFIFGVASSIKSGKGIKKEKLKEGLAKFFLYGGAVITGNLVDLVVFKAEVLYGFKQWIIIYLAFHEAISLVRHLKRLGVKFPPKLDEILENYQESLANNHAIIDKMKSLQNKR